MKISINIIMIDSCGTRTYGGENRSTRFGGDFKLLPNIANILGTTTFSKYMDNVTKSQTTVRAFLYLVLLFDI